MKGLHLWQAIQEGSGAKAEGGSKMPRGNRLLWTAVGALAVAYMGRMVMDRNAQKRRNRAARQLGGMVDVLSRTGRTVANGTMRLVRR